MNLTNPGPFMKRGGRPFIMRGPSFFISPNNERARQDHTTPIRQRRLTSLAFPGFVRAADPSRLSKGLGSNVLSTPWECVARPLRSEGDLLVRLPLVMTAHFDLDLLVQTLQKVEQLVRCEAAEMPVHQVGHIGLRNPENASDFALFQFPVLQNFENVNSNLRAGIKFAGILQPQIGEDVAGPFLKLNWFSSFHDRALTFALPRIAS